MVTNRDMYVLVNVHHDSWVWADVTRAGASYTQIQEKFYRLWYQIGTKLACKSSLLASEPINEPPGTTAAHAVELRKLEDLFLQAITDAGGFNPDRVATLNGPQENSDLTSHGADLTLNLILWDTPILSSTSSFVAAANGSSISIPVQWKGINKPATVKAVTANGTNLVDDFTSYYGPFQNARTTYNSQWHLDTDNVMITAAAVNDVQALGQDVIFTFEFYPRVSGNAVNYTLTV